MLHDALLLFLQNKKLLLLFGDFSVFLLILNFQLFNIFIALVHGFLVLVEVRSELDERGLQLIIFLTQVLFSLLELDFHLLEVFLLVDVSFLVLVHFTTLVEETSCRRNCVQFLNGYQVFLGLLVHL